MNTFEADLPDEHATGRLGRAVAEVARGGDVVALRGELGAGKTTLVRAMSEALGVDPREIGSPTFAILHEYLRRGGGRVMHVDAYRLDGVGDLVELGWSEWSRAEDCITCVEWADRLGSLLDGGLTITLHHASIGRTAELSWDQEPQLLESLVAGLAEGATP